MKLKNHFTGFSNGRAKSESVLNLMNSKILCGQSKFPVEISSQTWPNSCSEPSEKEKKEKPVVRLFKLKFFRRKLPGVPRLPRLYYTCKITKKLPEISPTHFAPSNSLRSARNTRKSRKSSTPVAGFLWPTDLRS